MFIRDIPNAICGTVIDVRSREEYDLSHATGSINIPWDLHLYYLNELDELPRPWLLCCEEGIRSGWVALSLKMLGYEEVYNVGRWFDVDGEKAEILAKAA
ncbi:MAG: rhodanese-like domain-containing protein [Lewinellaceae bacterium]|nr:rhodanese-like domain-containing protein [Lewinellaceae bacterium]